MSNEYPPPNPGHEPGNDPGQTPEGQPAPPPPPPSEPQWNPQSAGTPPAGYDQSQYGGQPQYGQPPGYPPQVPGAPGGFGAPQQTSPLAIVSLVLGIIGVPCCTFFLFGIGAVVTGLIARKQINESQGRLKGGGMATAGLILGAITIVIALVYWILALTGAIDTNWEFQTS